MYRGGPAHRAGLQAGDVVGRIDGKHVSSGSDVRTLLMTLPSGTKATVEITRDGNPFTVIVPLEKRPDPVKAELITTKPASKK